MKRSRVYVFLLPRPMPDDDVGTHVVAELAGPLEFGLGKVNQVVLSREEAMAHEGYRAALAAWNARNDALYWEQVGREEAIWEAYTDRVVGEIEDEEGGEEPR